MAMRVRIAAAACVIASGLFVGGACATVAFADPESGHGGENRGPQAGDHRDGDGWARPSGSAPGGKPVGEPSNGRGPQAGSPGGRPKPNSQEGDGRDGAGSGRPRDGAGNSPDSKHSETDQHSPPQTGPTRGGEPGKPGTPPRGGPGEQGPGRGPDGDEDPGDGNDPRGPGHGGGPQGPGHGNDSQGPGRGNGPQGPGTVAVRGVPGMVMAAEIRRTRRIRVMTGTPRTREIRMVPVARAVIPAVPRAAATAINGRSRRP